MAHTLEKCKFEKCGYEGYMRFYAKFFEAVVKEETVFRCHYGSECPKCGRWQKWEHQNDFRDELLNNKFYEEKTAGDNQMPAMF